MGKTKDKLKELKLTKRQIEFCLFYLESFNAKKAAIKAGLAKKNDAENAGMLVLLDENIKKAIQVLSECKKHAEMSDVLDMYSRIAYADCKDFISMVKNEKGEWVSEIDLEKIDGQIVEEISALKDGVKVKFYDKMKALEKMEKILGENRQETLNDENKNNITVVTNVKRIANAEEEKEN